MPEPAVAAELTVKTPPVRLFGAAALLALLFPVVAEEVAVFPEASCGKDPMKLFMML